MNAGASINIYLSTYFERTTTQYCNCKKVKKVIVWVLLSSVQRLQPACDTKYLISSRSAHRFLHKYVDCVLLNVDLWSVNHQI